MLQALLVFIPLVSMDETNGQTEILLHSTTAALSQTTGKVALTSTTKAPLVHEKVSLTMQRGEIAIFDSRLLHRGTKNQSRFDRPVLVFTVTSEKDQFNQDPSVPIYD